MESSNELKIEPIESRGQFTPKVVKSNSNFSIREDLSVPKTIGKLSHPTEYDATISIFL